MTEMTVLKPETDDRAGGVPPSAPDSARVAPRRRRVGRAALLLAGILALPLAAGFLWFVWRMPPSEIALNGNADGIVVLTGGTSRIADAIELLASGRGKQLLITGVHPNTNPDEISRRLPEHERTVRCCVDLDHSAINTLGNAIATREWIKRRGFRSLIVVTSNYHMPRAMAELANQLPDVQLIPFPVVSDRLGEPWWSHGATTRLLLSEYVKYIVAMFRMRLDAASPAGQESRMSFLRRPIDPGGVRPPTQSPSEVPNRL
jgi:uncharacterized SAM-binding protein YcdF (DUF218 family)